MGTSYSVSSAKRMKNKGQGHQSKNIKNKDLKVTGTLNNEPIIGIYSLPFKNDEKKGLIYANYVQWLEGGGARVIPIPSNISEKEAKKLLSLLNGLLFTGASKRTQNGLTSNARFLFQEALKLNEIGQYFPIWGTCLGFEWIFQIVGDLQSANTDHKIDAEDYAIPLNLTFYGSQLSRLFNQASSHLKQVISTENITYNHHHSGLSLTKWKESDRLHQFFNIVSTNFDRKNLCFVSMYEAKNFPIYGAQWHPEKNIYEFTSNPNNKNIPHTRNARWIAQYLSNFFVDECRKSQHHFVNLENEDKALIYNYPLTKNPGSNFKPVYIFNWKETNQKKSEE